MKSYSRFGLGAWRLALLLSFQVFLLLGAPYAVKAEKYVNRPINALLISLEKYQLSPLKYAGNDIQNFGNLLQTKFGAQAQMIQDMPGSFQPTNEPDTYKKAIEQRIADWCSNLKDNETAILYYGGHGITREGKLYLPMINYDPNRFDETVIPMSWVREQLDSAQAKCKLILLDTCFSGTGKGIELVPLADAVSMAHAFDAMDNVTTVASSREDQQSWIWDEAHQSLFTYWLIQAFRGNADSDRDHYISLDELTDYLINNVTRISETYETKDKMERQSPIVLNAESAKGEFSVPIPTYTDADALFKEIAPQVDLTLRTNGYQNILIAPKFVTGPEGNQIDPSYGKLPEDIAERFRRQLSQFNPEVKPYTVFRAKSVADALQNNKIKPEDLGGDKTGSLEIAGKPVQVIAAGRINMLNENILSVEIDLIDAQDQGDIATYRGDVAMNGDLLASMGASFVLPEATNPAPVTVDRIADPSLLEAQEVGGANLLVPVAAADKIREMTNASEDVHPMLNPRLPFAVKVCVRPARSNGPYKERAGMLIDNEYYVPLNKGEEYAIDITNKNDYPVFAKILIDGCDTVAQRMKTVENEKGVALEPAADKVNGDIQERPHVELTKAVGREYTPKMRYSIDAFWNTYETEKNAARFEVTDSYDEELRNRDDYQDQLGLITIGFFKSVDPNDPGSRGPHDNTTTGGETYTVKTEKSKNVAGDLLAVYNIRYVSQKLFDELRGGRSNK